MGGVSREKGVLKLVRPGGIVETHNTPVTAAQVMEWYPRHCVTRPDVFKYPWIVVRPESVLSLGRVFYVVPRHTIRRLLQSNGLVKGSHNNASSRNEKTLADDQAEESVTIDHVDDANDYEDDRLVKNAGRQHVIEPSSFRKLARESPQTRNHHIHKGRLNPKFPDGYLFHETVPSNQNNDPILKMRQHSKKKQHEHSLMMVEYKTDKHKVRPTPQGRSIVEERQRCQLKKYDSDNDVQGCFPVRRNVGALEPKKCNLKVTTNLKPCLKKNITRNNTMQRGPRVTFNVPEDDHEEKLGIEVVDS